MTEEPNGQTGGPTGGEKYTLHLYVAGEGPRTSRAVENLQRICREHLDDRYEIEVTDISENPEAAAEQDIVAVPTLVKKLPPPLRRVIGDLSRTEKVLVGLEIETV